MATVVLHAILHFTGGKKKEEQERKRDGVLPTFTPCRHFTNEFILCPCIYAGCRYVDERSNYSSLGDKAIARRM